MTTAATKDHAPAVAGLNAIDEQICATTGGEPGTGVYSLLNMLANQFLGVPRAAMPTPKAPAEAAAIEETEHERNTRLAEEKEHERERLADEKESNARSHHRTK